MHALYSNWLSYYKKNLLSSLYFGKYSCSKLIPNYLRHCHQYYTKIHYHEPTRKTIINTMTWQIDINNIKKLQNIILYWLNLFNSVKKILINVFINITEYIYVYITRLGGCFKRVINYFYGDLVFNWIIYKTITKYFLSFFFLSMLFFIAYINTNYKELLSLIKTFITVINNTGH